MALRIRSMFSVRGLVLDENVDADEGCDRPTLRIVVVHCLRAGRHKQSEDD